MQRSRRTYLALGIAALVIGISVLLYRGPGRALVRGHLGDVAATMLVFAVLSLLWRVRTAARAVTTLAIAIGIEVAQTWWHASSTLGHLTLGSTFDPWDFVAYVAGVTIAVAWERVGTRR